MLPVFWSNGHSTTPDQSGFEFSVPHLKFGLERSLRISPKGDGHDVIISPVKSLSKLPWRQLPPVEPYCPMAQAFDCGYHSSSIDGRLQSTLDYPAGVTKKASNAPTPSHSANKDI
ncbi:hypothetical protein QQF64_010106 [Cirrhinus molitorella]|uniref:Uncharacterized protein n=1 Tax=Cirrhinus molitorella TaxID=172907 RepID=A0ABR3M6J0_9TELE